METMVGLMFVELYSSQSTFSRIICPHSHFMIQMVEQGATLPIWVAESAKGPMGNLLLVAERPTTFLFLCVLVTCVPGERTYLLQANNESPEVEIEIPPGGGHRGLGRFWEDTETPSSADGRNVVSAKKGCVEGQSGSRRMRLGTTDSEGL